jgi:hypothetical protein
MLKVGKLFHTLASKTDQNISMMFKYDDFACEGKCSSSSKVSEQFQLCEWELLYCKSTPLLGNKSGLRDALDY